MRTRLDKACKSTALIVGIALLLVALAPAAAFAKTNSMVQIGRSWYTLTKPTLTAKASGKLYNVTYDSRGRRLLSPLTGRVYVRQWQSATRTWMTKGSVVATGGVMNFTMRQRGLYRLWFPGDATHNGSVSGQFVVRADAISIANVTTSVGSVDASGFVPVRFSFDVSAPAGVLTTATPGVAYGFLFSSETSSSPWFLMRMSTRAAADPKATSLVEASDPMGGLEFQFEQRLNTPRHMTYEFTVPKADLSLHWFAGIYVFAYDQFVNSAYVNKPLGVLAP